MPEHQFETVLLDLDALVPNDRNPQRGDVGAIATAIAVDGWHGSVMCQAPNGRRKRPKIFAGEHRWRGLRSLNTDGIVLDGTHLSYEDLLARDVLLPPKGKVPAQLLSLADVRAMRKMLADNRVQDLSTYDDGALAELLAELASSDDLMGSAFDEESLDALLYQIRLAEGPLDTTNTVKTPSDRIEDYLSKGIRSIILPLPTDLHEELVRDLAAMRAAWSVESNAEVVLRLAREAASRL